MQVGLVGAGNMARAMARGWGMPIHAFDPVPGRAKALAEETGGKAFGSNAELAAAVDLVVLCHKPAQLEAVAEEVATHARRVASILGATPLAKLRAAYGDVPVYRFLPSTPVEVGAGVVCHVPSGAPDEDEVAALFAQLGRLEVFDESTVDVAMGLMSNAPAYMALVAEAQIDAGVRRGLPAERAAELVVQTMEGTAKLIRAREMDTLSVRREVTSPGGSTARGLAALERGGLRTAFNDALDAVLG
ncbi:MAG TPA: pyrroline-5-carboxylate reductase dimerization domain-containing protein [Solirubrobacteraceae bacterium]